MISYKIGILLISILYTSGLLSQTTIYKTKYKPLADSLAKVYDIPFTVILGVAIVESSSGTARYCNLLNNHFGKTGKNNLLKTHKIRTKYKQYPNVTSSYLDFCRFISRKPFYPKLRGNKDYHLWINAISKTGYSELPEVWRKRVISVIKKHLIKS